MSFYKPVRKYTRDYYLKKYLIFSFVYAFHGFGYM